MQIPTPYLRTIVCGDEMATVGAEADKLQEIGRLQWLVFAGRDDAARVLTEHSQTHGQGMPHRRTDPAPGKGIPQRNQISAKYRKAPTVRAERRAPDRLLIRHDGTDRFSSQGIPELRTLVGEHD